MGRRKDNKGLSPWDLRKILGDSAELIAWMDAEAGATELKDYSGNGHTLTPNAVEFEQRPLAPGLYGRSAYFNGVSSHIGGPDFTADVENASFSICGVHFSDGRTDGQQVLVGTWSSRPYYAVKFSSNLFVWTLAFTDNAFDRSISVDATNIYGTSFFWCVTVDRENSEMSLAVEGRDLSIYETQAIAPDSPALFSNDALWIGATSGGGVHHFQGPVGFVCVSRSVVGLDKIEQITELSGVRDAPAYYQPFYVSDYPTSPRRYFAEYVADYLDAIGKPAVEVWPKRRYGKATGRGVKGAHDGSFIGTISGDDRPVVDDYGLGLKTDGDTANRLAIDDTAALNFTAVDSFTVLHVGEFDAISGGTELLVSKTALSTGWQLYKPGSPNRPFMRVLDGTNDRLIGSAGDFSAGTPSLSAGVVNRATQEMQSYLNGQFGAVEDISAVGDLTNAGQARIAQGADGSTAVGAVTPYALTKAELDHLYEAAFDRTKRLSQAELAAL